jgi:hypothetical protein
MRKGIGPSIKKKVFNDTDDPNVAVRTGPEWDVAELIALKKKLARIYYQACSYIGCPWKRVVVVG